MADNLIKSGCNSLTLQFTIPFGFSFESILITRYTILKSHIPPGFASPFLIKRYIPTVQIA